MVKTLFTGAEGFFGTTLLRQNTSWIPSSQYKHDAERLTQVFGKPVHQIDLSVYQQVSDVVGQIRPDRIVNLGAQSRPDISWKHPIETVNANINGTLHLLHACHEHGLKPIILLASTSAQYGEIFEDKNMRTLIDEQAPQKPINPYGLTKAAAERLAYLLAKHYQLDVRYARIFNTSGYGKLGDVISDFSKRAVQTSNNRIIVGNLEPLRCFLHIEDTLSALKIIMENGTAGQAYNICASSEYSVREILNIIGQMVGKDIVPEIRKSLFRPTDELRIRGSSEKLKALGWREKYDIKDVIMDCIRFHKGIKI